MKKTDKRRKGFTLIELIVVIAILAILAAIAVPNFIGMTKKANNATEVAAAAQFASSMNIVNALATTDEEKIPSIPTEAELPDFYEKLLKAGVPVNVDIDDTKLISNVFNRLIKVNEAFMVDPDRKDDGPFAAPTTATSAG